MLFDTHAHFDDEAFKSDRDEVLKGLRADGVAYVMNIGSNMKTSKEALKIANKYDFVYASVGVHPCDTYNLTDDDMESLKQMALTNPKVRAIGEIGLDYHFDDTDAVLQKKWFIRQLGIAKELDMPVVIHDRDSKGEALKILKREGITKGVMHCFSGSAQTAAELVDMGFMISFTGVLTFKNARRAVEACRAVPIERLMIETDCPYMAPEPHRGERNYSGYVKYVAQKMAEIKEMPYEEVARITTENGLRFYGIK